MILLLLGEVSQSCAQLEKTTAEIKTTQANIRRSLTMVKPPLFVMAAGFGREN